MQVVEQDEASGSQRPIVMFNARLASGDAGVGLNTRRLLQDFLGSFAMSYSLQPVGENASIFKR